MEKYEKLKEALLKAREFAKLAAIADDDGTCNFDSPVLFYQKMGYQKQKAIDIIESIGLSAWAPSSAYWKGSLIISGATNGQGNCRTIMAEAFSKSLEESEIESSVYYRMN